MAKLVSSFYVVALLLSAIVQSNANAQEVKTEIEYYKNDDVTNQIPLLENRFRIDALLDEVTLLFYRKSGTPPIILIRPDGSKLKVNNYPKGEVEWYDDRTFDMIKMKKPMPGPWQAIGEIAPGSKIMVVTDVRLEVKPLPDIILAGETLKVLAKLYNREKAIDDPRFDDVIELDVDFYSTNNSSYDNFGATPVEMGSFRDDGYELDEYAKDGIFTAEFELTFAPGEWVPIYRVKMPMANRELRQEPIVLHPVPVKISVDKTVDEGKFHKIHFTIDDTYVDPDSMIFQGKITFPDKQSDPFSITEGNGKTRMKKVQYTEPGIHRLSVNAFGKTTNGREFRLEVPEFTFNVERKGGVLVNDLSEDATNSEMSSEEAALQEAALRKQAAVEKLQAELEQARLEMLKAAEEKKRNNIIIALVVNVFIIMIIAIGFIALKKPHLLRFIKKKS
ncbi:TIGR03503 family protein [Thalassotalea ganghwensis]